MEACWLLGISELFISEINLYSHPILYCIMNVKNLLLTSEAIYSYIYMSTPWKVILFLISMIELLETSIFTIFVEIHQKMKWDEISITVCTLMPIVPSSIVNYDSVAQLVARRSETRPFLLSITSFFPFAPRRFETCLRMTFLCHFISNTPHPSAPISI